MRTSALYLPRVTAHLSDLHRLSHKKADSKLAKNGRWFYAVLSPSEIKEQIADAERRGALYRREVVAIAHEHLKVKAKISPADLPIELQDRVAVTPQGCWVLTKIASRFRITPEFEIDTPLLCKGGPLIRQFNLMESIGSLTA